MALSRWALLYAAAASLAACSISPSIGEAPADCSDGDDNDRDGLTDCQDPDCQALGECSARALSRGKEPPSEGEIGDAYVAERPDATLPEPPEPPDAAPVEPPDAAEPPDATPDAEASCEMTGCPDGQTCDGKECIDDEVVVAELWDVTRIEVYAPRSVEEGGDPCLDPACIPYLPRSPFRDCGCAPDPQVQFWVDRDPTDDTDPELDGETTVANSRDEATWTMPNVRLRLLPISKIHMKMVDADGEVEEPMFGCTIEAGVVTAGGPMECTAPFPLGAAEPVEFYIRAQVAPAQVTPPE